MQTLQLEKDPLALDALSEHITPRDSKSVNHGITMNLVYDGLNEEQVHSVSALPFFIGMLYACLNLNNTIWTDYHNSPLLTKTTDNKIIHNEQ